MFWPSQQVRHVVHQSPWLAGDYINHFRMHTFRISAKNAVDFTPADGWTAPGRSPNWPLPPRHVHGSQAQGSTCTRKEFVGCATKCLLVVIWSYLLITFPKGLGGPGLPNLLAPDSTPTNFVCDIVTGSRMGTGYHLSGSAAVFKYVTPLRIM